MHQETDNPIPKYYKLTNGEDIVAYQIGETDSHLLLKQPMVVLIENDFSSARQLLNVREWIPPIILKHDEINLPKNLIMFECAVNDEFAEEFVNVVNYFYGVKPKKKAKKAAGKVVPLMIVKDDSGKTH